MVVLVHFVYNFDDFWSFFVCSCSFCTIFPLFSHFLFFFPPSPPLLTPLLTFLAYAFPYVMAFSTNAIEVRTLINGKLVQTLELPSLRLLTSKRGIYITICRDGAQEVLRVAAHTAEWAFLLVLKKDACLVCLVGGCTFISVFISAWNGPRGISIQFLSVCDYGSVWHMMLLP